MLRLSGSFREINAIREQIQGKLPVLERQQHGYRYFCIEEQADGKAFLMLEPVGDDRAKRSQFVSILRQTMPSLKIEQ